MTKTSHFSITQTSIMAVVGAIATAIVTLVPAWSGESKVIVAAIGGVVVAGFPLWNAIHKLADSILEGRKALADSNVSAKEIEANAIAVVRSEASKIDFTALVRDAVNAHGIGDVEGQVRAEVARVLQGMFGQAAQAPMAAPPIAPIPPVQ